MGTQRAIDEVDIRRRIEAGVAAVRAMDLEGVMALYAPDIVSFDIGSPLRSVGAEAKRRAWVEAFAMYQRPLGYEVRDLTIAVGDDVAFGHSVNRISGVLKNGTRPISGFGGRRASARSRATGSSSTIRFRCRWIRRPPQRCWISGRDNWSGGTEANSDRGLADQDRRTPASDDARSISGIPTHRRLDRRVLT